MTAYEFGVYMGKQAALGDGTGPEGEGPLTGQQLGYGAGFNAPGVMNPARKPGFRGRRRLPPEQMQALMEQLKREPEEA